MALSEHEKHRFEMSVSYVGFDELPTMHYSFVSGNKGHHHLLTCRNFVFETTLRPWSRWAFGACDFRSGYKSGYKIYQMSMDLYGCLRMYLKNKDI